MAMKTLQDAFIDEIKDLLSAERQLKTALPKMAKKATNPKLKEGFQTHLAETEGHIERLVQVFGLIGKKPVAKTCKAMQGLIEEGKEIMEEDADPDVMDAMLIAAAQKVEHYEIGSYGTVCTWAKLLGMKEAKDLLGQTLTEEKATDVKLSKLANSVVNTSALS